MKTNRLIGLALAFGLFTTTAASAQTYGAAYVSAITYTNTGLETANIAFSFYSEGSGTAVVERRTLVASASSSLSVGSLTSLSAGFKGSVVIDSDQPIVATLVQIPPSSISSKVRPLANGALMGKPRLILPRVFKGTFSTTSVFSVQNADNVDNDITVKFFNMDGSVAASSQVQSLPPGAAKYFDLGTVSSLPAGFNGTAEVVAARKSGAPGRAAAIVEEFGTASSGAMNQYATAFEGTAGATTTGQAITSMCNYGAQLNNSSHRVVNAGASEATVTPQWFAGNAMPDAGVFKLAPMAAYAFNPCTSGQTSGYLGAAIFNSTQPMTLLNTVSGGGQSRTWLGDDVGAERLVAPYVRWATDANYNASNGSIRSFLTIQNVGTQANAGPFSVRYYDADGNLVSTHNLTTNLAPSAKISSNPNWATPTNTMYAFGYTPAGGSAVIEGPPGSKLAVIVTNQSWVTYNATASLAVQAGESYNAVVPAPRGGNTKDYCAPSPCKNGGTCSNDVTSASCACKAGFQGATCDMVATDYCASSPCKNGGTCTNGMTAFTCDCAEGFTGATCNTSLNLCTLNPCQNGGTCTGGTGTFTCQCVGNYAGPTCTDADACKPSNPCQNGGTCATGANGAECTCAPGYSGATCATNINDCAPNPCQNGGTCTDGVNSYTCQCAPGYSGASCGTNIDDCSPNPCQNGGTCTDGVNSYTCQCAPGFSGPTCSTGTTTTATADFSTITGTSVTTFGGPGLVRGLEFNVTSPLTVTSIRVDGLPAGSEGTALLWLRAGAVNLQVTDTFPLGTPIAPSSSGSGSATFNFAPSKVFASGTHSVVVMVDDMSMNGAWSMRELANTGQSLTVGSVTFNSVWGWQGGVDMSNNAVGVSIYDLQSFRIPKVVMTFVP